MIDFTCPRCGDALSVPDGLAGEDELCPACHTKVRVPHAPSTEDDVVLNTLPASKNGATAKFGKIVLIGLVVIILAFPFGMVWERTYPTNANGVLAVTGLGLGTWSFGAIVSMVAWLVSWRRGRAVAKVVAVVISVMIGGLAGAGGHPELPIGKARLMGLWYAVLYGSMTWVVWVIAAAIWNAGRPAGEARDTGARSDSGGQEGGEAGKHNTDRATRCAGGGKGEGINH